MGLIMKKGGSEREREINKYRCISKRATTITTGSNVRPMIQYLLKFKELPLKLVDFADAQIDRKNSPLIGRGLTGRKLLFGLRANQFAGCCAGVL
jgi:hypothetical protein